MKLTIRTKLLLGFGLILFLSAIAQIVAYPIIYRLNNGHIYEMHSEKAHSASVQIQNLFTQINFSLLAISKEYSGGGTSTEELTKVIEFVINQNPNVYTISIIGPKDKELIRYTRADKLISADYLNYVVPNESYGKALDGLISITKVYPSEVDQTPRVDVYYPMTVERKIIGVIKAQIGLTRLWDLMGEVRLGKDGFAYVVDDEGRLLTHPRFDTLTPMMQSRQIVADLLTKPASEIKTNYQYVNDTNTTVIANGTRVPGVGWAVIVEEPTSQALGQIYSIGNIYLITFIFTITTLIIISVLLSNNISKPIQELNTAATMLSTGNYSKRARVMSHDEIGRLALTFNVMVDQLSEKIKLLTKRDVELKEKDALTTSERNKLQIVLQGINDAVIAVDLDRRIIIFNQAAEKLTGFTVGEAIGQYIDNILRLFDEYGVRLEGGLYCPIEHNTFEGIIYQRNALSMFTKDDHHIYVNIICGKIAESEEVNFGPIITLHDVTEEIELDKMKLDFVSLAAHELRTPLTSIHGYLDAFKQDAWQKINTDEQRMINRIELSAQQLSSLMENLLSVSKIENGTYNLNTEQVDWVHFVNDRVSDLRRQAEEHGLELTWKEPKFPTPQVSVDKFRIGEVLDNLVTNAIRYTPKGKITISVSYDPVKKMVNTEVSDTGQGIPTEAIPHMFKKFFRVSGTLEQGSKGTGLGLYISKAILTLHNGDIWVKSDGVGKGATFGFSLPVTDSNTLEVEKN